MREKKGHLGRNRRLLIAAGVALMGTNVTGRLQAQTVRTKVIVAGQKMPQGNFYCNIKALNSAERAHHKELTDKLIAFRKDIAETEKGYEFQFSPANVSLAELADWVTAEGKCCPFFDFHIDQEHAGNLLCLRLTGEEGIKQFIRLEFQVPPR